MMRIKDNQGCVKQRSVAFEVFSICLAFILTLGLSVQLKSVRAESSEVKRERQEIANAIGIVNQRIWEVMVPAFRNTVKGLRESDESELADRVAGVSSLHPGLMVGPLEAIMRKVGSIPYPNPLVPRLKTFNTPGRESEYGASDTEIYTYRRLNRLRRLSQSYNSLYRARDEILNHPETGGADRLFESAIYTLQEYYSGEISHSEEMMYKRLMKMINKIRQDLIELLSRSQKNDTVPGDDEPALYDYCAIVKHPTFQKICYTFWASSCKYIVDKEEQRRCMEALQPGGPRNTRGEIWDFCASIEDPEAQNFCYDGYRKMVPNHCGVIEFQNPERQTCMDRAANLPSNLPD